MATAHLVLTLDADTLSVVGCGVFGAPWEGLTLRWDGKFFYVNGPSGEGDDYTQAMANLAEVLRKIPGWGWAVTWLEEGKPMFGR